MMENAVGQGQTLMETPPSDPYAFPAEEPFSSDLSSGCQKGQGLPLPNPKTIPLEQLPLLSQTVQDLYSSQHNTSLYQQASLGLSPGAHRPDSSTILPGIVKQETATKKKKGKLADGTEENRVKKQKKASKVKNIANVTAGAEGTVSSADLPYSDATYHPASGDPKHNVLSAKTAAPLVPSHLAASSDLNSSPHPYPYPGSNYMMSSSSPNPPVNFPSSGKTIPEGRRQSVDSQDQSNSRPGSRASTVSTSSNSEMKEVKSKEPVDVIPLSKVLEIIEREKALGSSSPCKRRRSAKPQHIQDAEEEAKRYAMSNNIQPSSTNATVQKTPPASKSSLSQNSQPPSTGIGSQKLPPASVNSAVQHSPSVSASPVVRKVPSASVSSAVLNSQSAPGDSAVGQVLAVSISSTVQNSHPVSANTAAQNMTHVMVSSTVQNSQPVDVETKVHSMLPVTVTSALQNSQPVTVNPAIQNRTPITVSSTVQNVQPLSAGSVQVMPGGPLPSTPQSTHPVSNTSLTQNVATPGGGKADDAEFCCSGCEKEGSVSSKNCEEKLGVGFSPSPQSPALDSDGSLKLAAAVTQKLAAPSQAPGAKGHIHQLQSPHTEYLKNIGNVDSVASSKPHSKEAAELLTLPIPNNASGTNLTKPSTVSPIGSYQQNGFHLHHQTQLHMSGGVSNDFGDAYKHFISTTAPGSVVTSHRTAETVSTTVTTVATSASQAPLPHSSVKIENSGSVVMNHPTPNHGATLGKDPASFTVDQRSHLQSCLPNVYQSAMLDNPSSSATVSQTFAHRTTSPVATRVLSVSGRQAPQDWNSQKPSTLKSNAATQNTCWSQNDGNILGMESFLPQTNPPPLPGHPAKAEKSSASPFAHRSSASASTPLSHQASSLPTLPNQSMLPNTGPLPPFGAFAGFKTGQQNINGGFNINQFSGIQNLNSSPTKKETPVVKKARKRQKVASKPQNNIANHPVSKQQKGSTDFSTLGLKERNVKPLSGNWSNMQQVTDDKSNLKPVSGDYPVHVKTSFTASGDVKTMSGPHSNASVGLGTGGIVNGSSQPTTYQPPPSPAPSTLPNLANMTPEEELADRLASNRVESAPDCGCLGPNYVFNESMEGPYYTQLGAAKDLAGLRQMMEERTGLTGNAIRIEKIHYTGKEGRSAQGCPIAKWIIRRSGPEEKYLCVARKRPGHFCNAAYILVVIVAWEGVASQQADSLYNYLVPTLTKHGFETDRRCGSNEQKTCACQGADLLRRGASFSFGCSWSMYFNGCKFARSHIARKFKLKDTQKEEELEEHLQNLATMLGPLYKMAAPDAYRNQVHFEEKASMCRLGHEKGRPFSGVTACVDFCAHSHKDFHNMQNGSTVVVTLTKHRDLAKPDDEQLHVLPLYVMDNTDESGSIDGQMAKVQSGALEILHHYPVQARLRAAPLTPKRRGRQSKKDSPAKKGATSPADGLPGGGRSSAPGTPTPSTPDTKDPNLSFHSQDSCQSLPDSFSGSSSTMQSPDKGFSSGESSFVDKENSSASEDIFSQPFGPSELYEKVWEYFDSNGTFPPQAFMEKLAAVQKEAMMNPPPQGAVTNNGATHLSGQNGSSSGSRPPSHFQREAAEQQSPSSGPQQMASSPVGAQRPSSQPPSPFPSQQGSNPPSPFPSPTAPNQRSFDPSSPAHSSSGVNNHSEPGSPSVSARSNCDGTHPPVCNDDASTHSSPVMRPNGSFVTPTLGQGPDEPTFTMMDPTVVKHEWQDNKESFRDPGIGGVAIALSHGAVLFEVAKRELHATTALKNPNRYQPTRISLVFYQHKNLNFYHHGYYEYERKLATQRQKRMEKLMEEGATMAEAEQAVKPGRKRKKKEGEEEEEKVDFAKTSAAQYKYMWEAGVKYSSTLTTDSIITRWIDPQPMVTGPYQRWV